MTNNTLYITIDPIMIQHNLWGLGYRQAVLIDPLTTVYMYDTLRHPHFQNQFLTHTKPKINRLYRCQSKFLHIFSWCAVLQQTQA